jgi:hypothetical protein
MTTIAQPSPCVDLLLRLKRYVRQPVPLLVFTLLWTLFILGGLTVMLREEFTPVAASDWLAGFPAATSLPLAPDRPTLVVFAHPHCPCTRATLHGISQVLASVKDRLSVVIVFTVPPGVANDWENGELLQTAEKLSGVQVIIDRGGKEAGQFRVVGSGTALLYAPTGRLLFSGGVTSSRGHDGDSVGGDAITSLVLHGTTPVSHTPVYGCALL